MRREGTPILDPRDAARVLAELLARRPAYLPEWLPAPEQGGWALLQILARYAEIIIDRLNQAPDRNKLAFLDMLGISLIPAQPARAPVVFEPMPNAGNGRIPAGIRLGAQVPSQSDTLMFETERGIAMAAARLVEVKTLWPARDEYADHTQDYAGGRPFELFANSKPVPHELYLAHDTLLAFAGRATLEIELELSTVGSDPMEIAWEYWDGQTWRPFADDDESTRDGTLGLTRSGVISLQAECGDSQKTTIHGIEAYWIKGRLDQALSPDAARVLPEVDRIRLRTIVIKSYEGGLQPELAFADSSELDLSKSFYPFGRQTGPGSTFYFSSGEAFSKAGARITIAIARVNTPQDISSTSNTDTSDVVRFVPELVAEYWNGERWNTLSDLTNELLVDFFQPSIMLHPITFILPTDVSITEVNGEIGFWLRIRIHSGSFSVLRTLQWTDYGDFENPKTNTINVLDNVPPAVFGLFIAYEYRSTWNPCQHCLTCNDFQYQVHSRDVRWPGNFFAPFKPVSDKTPSLYLGLGGPLPNDLLSLYLDMGESETTMPPLVWESWDGEDWSELRVADETADLGRPGMLSFIAPDVLARPQAAVREAGAKEIVAVSALEAAVFTPGQQVTIKKGESIELGTVEEVVDDRILLQAPLTGTYKGGTVQLAALPRFGVSRDWLRARLKFDGAPPRSSVNGLYLNAAWARQVQTLNNEVLGSGTGQPGEAFFFTQVPVLPAERIEVRELDGPRAQVELPILRDTLIARGLAEDDIRAVTDPRTGRVREVWVRWQERDHLFFSGPEDRHYMMERARGRLIFGDGTNGMIPPPGPNNILARRYQAGGGVTGNVAAGAINQLLGSAPYVQKVSNPRAADGGADAETLDEVYTRGPQTLRHRRRALSARDYEEIAREASPGVAAARALPATALNGRPAPGWVTVIVVPQSSEPQPQPSLELRDVVHAHLLARAPATMAAERLAVIGPTYLPIGVSAVVVPRDLGEAGAVEAAVLAALARFLHPLTGGPEGRGWPFGRAVYLSDVAALLEGLTGVDHVEDLNLLLHDTPRGEWIGVPPDRIVVAGTLRVEMKAPAV